MSLLKKLAGETAIYGTSSILSRLLHYVILTPYFTRVFGQGEYGVVSDMYTWAALLLVLFTYRMETAFFRYGSRDEDMEKSFSTASLSLLLSTVVLVALFILAANPIADWLKYPGHPEYVIWFAFIIGLDALSAIPFARLRLENRPIRFAIIKTLNILVNIFFIFLFLEVGPWLIAHGWKGLEAVYQWETRITYVFISNCLASTAVLIMLLPLFRKMKFEFDPALWRRMLAYAAPLVIVGVAGVINQLIGIPMIKELGPGGLAENIRMMGVYSAATKIAVLMNLFTQAFNYAAEPFFFKNAGRSDKDSVYAQVGQAFALVGSLVFIGIMLYLDLIQYFLGRDFREGLGVVPLLLLSYIFLGLYYNFSIWYKLADRTAIGGWIATGGSVITIALNIWLIPTMGYYGPGWAALACYLFMALASYWTGQRFYPIPYPVGRILAYISSALLIYAASLWLDGLLQPGLAGTLALHTGLLGLWLLGILGLERQQVRKLFLRKR
ncbi:MAG: oligosaccharide flippase family protein [Phaeodactylibacter sp.]|nr:oligosaccharide flippase family protein [Phaeodactylibacter sp.]MCB9272716.1 oligosaccharide flippase family protein [Lewinellaceae bacterium]